MNSSGSNPDMVQYHSWPILFKRVNKTVDEKRLTDAQFLGVANAFDTI